jgi:hypothetical protein
MKPGVPSISEHYQVLAQLATFASFTRKIIDGSIKSRGLTIARLTLTFSTLILCQFTDTMLDVDIISSVFSV